MTALALAAHDITVTFGGVVACDGIDLEVAEGAIVGLTGPNGSGKSTLLNAVNGLVPATGTLRLFGDDVPLGAARSVRAHGVIRLFQAPQILGDLSCLENVLLSHPDRRGSGLLAAVGARPLVHRHERRRWDDATRALDRVGLAHTADLPGTALTYGQQRLLELARAMAGAPSILLLDEPSAGLNASETEGLAALLSSLRGEGMSMVVIDHKVDFLDGISDRIAVLQLGRVIAEGDPADIWRHPEVVDAYLGVPHDDETPGVEGDS